MTSMIWLAFAAFLQAAPRVAASPVHAPAGATAGPPSAAVAAASPEDGKVVCRRFNQTGSRLGGTTECATKAQWRERERDSADYLRGAQAKASQFSPH